MCQCFARNVGAAARRGRAELVCLLCLDKFLGADKGHRDEKQAGRGVPCEQVDAFRRNSSVAARLRKAKLLKQSASRQGLDKDKREALGRGGVCASRDAVRMQDGAGSQRDLRSRTHGRYVSLRRSSWIITGSEDERALRLRPEVARWREVKEQSRLRTCEGGAEFDTSDSKSWNRDSASLSCKPTTLNTKCEATGHNEISWDCQHFCSA